MSSDWQATEVGTIARRLMRSVESGILSTMSTELPGYPFGSVTPFVLAHDGRIMIYVSAIAQHTANILENPKVCITVLETSTKDGESSQQALGRVTLVGDAAVTGDADRVAAERYFQFFPRARRYSETHDFSFVAITPQRVRYIGGFGKIHWIEPLDWNMPVFPWASGETEIMDHMNSDHLDSLVAIADQHTGKSIEVIEMLAVDAEGFHVNADGDVIYFPFESPCQTADDLRKALVAMARSTRGG